MSETSAVTLEGVELDPLSESEAVDRIVDDARQGQGGWVSTPNTQQLALARHSPPLRELIQDASLVLADGMPLVWASRLQGTPLPERVAGSSLVWSLAREAAAAELPLFLLGGEEGVAARAADVLRERVPGIEIVGTHCPPLGFERDPSAVAQAVEAVVTTQPSIVYVGLGFPKQEQLITGLQNALPRAWFLGVGVSLSFISGDVSRAPAGLQRLGLEWLYRLCREPSRLWRRYLVDGVPFTLSLLARCAWRRL